MKSLVIPAPQLSQPEPGVWRVTTRIDDQDVFVESNLPLSPRVDGFVCALTLPSMMCGLNLDVRAPMGPAIIENLRQARALARHWWPELREIELHAPAGVESKRAPGKGLFFTGGVDSSFALYRLKDEVSELLYVEGFDVSLTDTVRLQHVRDWLQSVATATGCRLRILRTNLRSLRLFNTLHWEYTHITALAAVAHTLGDQLGTVFMAASDVPPPYGSHPALDKLWSSGSVELVNFGAEYSRLQRVAAIREWAPLRGHLRVCWQHLAETLNCGHCEKCLRTRLQLLAVGDPRGLDSFPDVPVAVALARLEQSSHELHSQYREIQAALGAGPIREAIDALLARSLQPPPLSLMQRWKRWERRKLRKRSNSVMLTPNPKVTEDAAHGGKGV